MKIISYTLAIIFVVGTGAWFFVDYTKSHPPASKSTTKTISSFAECAKKYPVMESFPRQCATPSGQHFVEEIDGVVPDPAHLPPETDPVDEVIIDPDESGCIVSGCNGELCIAVEHSNDIASTCAFKESYTCYANAECGRNENNECEWIETEELQECLLEFEEIEQV